MVSLVLISDVNPMGRQLLTNAIKNSDQHSAELQSENGGES